MAVEVTTPKDALKRRKAAGYAAICAIAVDAEPGVFRLGAIEDLEVLLSRLQLGTWHELYLVRAIWTPGLAVARTIADGVEEKLTASGSSLARHWYRADLEFLDAAIETERARLRSPVWSHEELIARLRREANAEADRFAAGII